jgi:hypothetical protein
MGHMINGFIARHDALAAATGNRGLTVCILPQGFGLGLLSERATVSDSREFPYRELQFLSEYYRAWAETFSTMNPIAYIETEYFGGAGVQAAIAWHDRHVAIGPLQTRLGQSDLLNGAIDQCLRAVAAVRGQALDEFDALKLGLYRNNEEWISRAEIA